MMSTRDASDGTYDLSLFEETASYYARCRPGIPEEVVEFIVRESGLAPEGSALDLGCGTGQLAIPLARHCARVVAMDPDPSMIAEAKRAAATLPETERITWIAGGSLDLAALCPGTNLVTICRAFHWMDQRQVLRDLDRLVTPDGGVAILGDGSFWTGNEPWQTKTKEVIRRWLGSERRAGKATYSRSEEKYEDILRQSAFPVVRSWDFPVIRTWAIDAIIGCLYSTSFASRRLFGNKVEAFEAELREELAKLGAHGLFREPAVFHLILARRA